MRRLHEHQKLPKLGNFFFHLLWYLDHPKLFLVEISTNHILKIDNSGDGQIDFLLELNAGVDLSEAPFDNLARWAEIIVPFVEAKVENPHRRNDVLWPIQSILVGYLLELEVHWVFAIRTVPGFILFATLMFQVQFGPKNRYTISLSQTHPVVKQDFQAWQLAPILPDPLFPHGDNLFCKTPNFGIHLLQDYVAPHKFDLSQKRDSFIYFLVFDLF